MYVFSSLQFFTFFIFFLGGGGGGGGGGGTASKNEIGPCLSVSHREGKLSPVK